MGTKCNHCGMESDKAEICTWCGTDIAPSVSAKAREAKGKEPTPLGAKPAASPAAKAKSPLGRKTYASTEQQKSGVPVWVYYAAPVAILVIALVAWSGLKARAAQAPLREPSDWTPIKSQNGNISMQVPAGWEWRTSGASGTFEMVLVKGGEMSTLSIMGSQTKGAMGDIAGAAARTSASPDGGPTPLDRTPQGRLHTMLGAQYTKADPTYKEEGDMQAMTFGGLPAAASQFTLVKGVGLFKVKMKGIRMSAPGGDYGWDINFSGPEKPFDQFALIASKMLASVQLSK